jgi:ankyrin repeat protein
VIHVACLLGYDSIVSELIKVGADLEAKLWSGERPLHHACATGPVSIVMLLEEGVDFKAETRYKHRPIHNACCGGDVEIVSMLLQAGEDINVQSEDQ